jgi:sirohydrochlorin cobaltochelatase
LKEGIVLLGHGSPDPEWSQPFEKIAVSVGKRLPAVAVALAYLEHGPSLEEAVTALAAKGALSIRVVPLFLGTGGHVKEDLPKLVAQAKRAEIQLVLDKPIGEQPEVVEAIAGAISQSR